MTVRKSLDGGCGFKPRKRIHLVLLDTVSRPVKIKIGPQKSKIYI